MKEGKETWVFTGYEIFAYHGASGLKVETLSKKMGISKSSFYHHFADIELFIEGLLQHHINQSYIIAKKEKAANYINPDLIDILLEHKVDLLFNRQLRIGRENELYLKTALKSDIIVGDSFIDVWKKDLNLKLTKKQLEGVFGIALESFYLQINTENLNREWLLDYFKELKSVVERFV